MDGKRPRPSPTLAGSCMAAEWERALVSLQHAWSSLSYSSKGGTVGVTGAGLCLKKALACAESACGT